VVAVCGAARLRSTHRVPASAIPAVTIATSTRDEPTTVVAAVPTGFHHDQPGAVAAALHFLAMSERVIGMNDTDAAAAQRAMATSAAADRLVASLHTKLAALHDGFGAGPVGYRVAPLAVRVTPVAPDHVD